MLLMVFYLPWETCHLMHDKIQCMWSGIQISHQNSSAYKVVISKDNKRFMGVSHVFYTRIYLININGLKYLKC